MPKIAQLVQACGKSASRILPFAPANESMSGSFELDLQLLCQGIVLNPIHSQAFSLTEGLKTSVMTSSASCDKVNIRGLDKFESS